MWTHKKVPDIKQIRFGDILNGSCNLIEMGTSIKFDS